MDEMKRILYDRQKKYEKVLKDLEKRATPVHDARLIVNTRKDNVEYYVKQRDEKTGESKRTYLSKSKQDLARSIAQGHYEQSLKTKLLEILKYMRLLNRHYPDDGIESFYLKMSPSRRALIQPVVPTRKQLSDQWMAKRYNRMGFKANGFSYLTNNDEKVRSKSEKIISDILSDERIPYKYECPLFLDEDMKIVPDFTFYDPDIDREIYWEHFGMMDDEKYRLKTWRKINNYAHNEIIIGKNLIVTFESRLVPLDVRAVNCLIDGMLGNLKGLA